MAQLPKRTQADGRERHHDRPGGRSEAQPEDAGGRRGGRALPCCRGHQKADKFTLSLTAIVENDGPK